MELFELVHKDPEVWTPIKELGPVMQLIGEPQEGDFMAEQGGRTTLLCREVTRVKVLNVKGTNIDFEIDRGVPNWLQQAQQAMMAGPEGVFFGGVRVESGDTLVLDGRAIRLEKSREAATH